MNGLAVMLCVAALGVQQSWRTTPEGQLEYVLQVEPTFLASLEQGESITSTLPTTAKEVHRLCLRFSAGDLKKAPQRNPDLPPLESHELRAAKTEPDIPVAIVYDAQGRSEETTDITHGWQATKDGRVQYLVQLSPDLLGKLRDGDEIYMNVYPEAGQIQQFIVLAGQEMLPHKAAQATPHATLTMKEPKTIAPVAAENPAISGSGVDANPGPRLHGPRSSETKTKEPPRLPSPKKYVVADEPTEQPLEQPAEQPLYGAEQPLYGPVVENRGPAAAPDLFSTNPVEETTTVEQPEEAPLYGPAKSPTVPSPTRRAATAPRVAPAEAPDFDRSQFDKSQFADAPINKPKTTHASLTPEREQNQYLPDSETRHSKPHTSFAATDRDVAATAAEEERTDINDNRTASVETPKRRTSLSAGSTKSSKNAPSSDNTSPEPAGWGAWMFVCCALFLSIGGNLYLGWTAAEFYSRYRLAIERMRGSSRESDRDTRVD
ncbi:MAG: hypothetical protein K8R36_11645 [Planctomycetales bacterium]|nr:hypothetical protein [Planctomycetales bacterium]